MTSIPNLPRAIQTLARIADAGLLEDFEYEVANATRGPGDDLERWPHYKFGVGKFARLASRVFALPIGECHAAACEALLPSTRRGIALEILEQFEERLDAEAVRETAGRKLIADRRRRRTA
jgi:hypothetical protein